jgi:hypothetical protein
MKKVEDVEQADDVKTNWKAQVLWSHRIWESTIVEQVPDSHIVWRSKGAKGYVDGAVTFTGLGPNLTRVLLVLEYHPQGLFEYTGNLWRAQGRRARLEFQHFRRHAMTHVLMRQDEIEGWRGEIRDGEVVRTHEEALEEERRDREVPDEARNEPEEAEAGYADEEEPGEEDYEEDEYAEDEYAEEQADEEPVDEERADVSAEQEERDEPVRRSARATAAKNPPGRSSGRSTSATATVRRTASGAAGKAAADRKPRARRGGGDG